MSIIGIARNVVDSKRVENCPVLHIKLYANGDVEVSYGATTSRIYASKLELLEDLGWNLSDWARLIWEMP